MLVVAALATISTAQAFDYKFNLEGRADFISSEAKTSATGVAATEADTNSFVSNLIRLNMMGNINETLSYRMRYRFNTEGTTTARDSSTTALDYLYVDHKMTFVTFRFGKTNWAEAYGRESFISSTDLFLATDAYRAYNANIGNYRFSASATSTFMDTHKVTVAVSNPNTAVTDSATGGSKNTSLAYAIHYSSVMFDKMFQPTLSYTLAHQDGDAGRKAYNNTMWAAGFRTEVANFIIDADYKQFDKAYDNAAAATTTTYNQTALGSGTYSQLNGKTSSIFANIAYSMDMLSPFVQYSHDSFDAQSNTTTNNDRNTYVAGVMYKPYTDINFRYHLAYGISKQEFDVGGAEFKDNRIIFGIKADI